MTAAGGGMMRDLFAEEMRTGYLTDAKLLTRLADEKLKAIAEPIKAEGWKWVEIKPDFDWTEQEKFGRSGRITKEQEVAMAALKRSRTRFTRNRATMMATYHRSWKPEALEIEQQMDTLRGRGRRSPCAEAIAGVVITIGHAARPRSSAA